MQIAVCDDEKEIGDMFAEKIARLYPKAALSLYQSGEELLLSAGEPDILLLDIQMPGKNGMETVKELRKRNKMITRGGEHITVNQYLRYNQREKVDGAGYILFCFAKPFMENKKGAFCIVIAYFATMLILYFVPIEINTFAAYGLGILSAFIVMCRIDRRNYKQKIFIAVTFYSLDWLSEYMARIITDAIYNTDRIHDNFFITGGHPVTQLMIFGGVELLDMAIGYGIMIHYQTESGTDWMAPISDLYNGLAFLYFGISIITIVVGGNKGCIRGLSFFPYVPKYKLSYIIPTSDNVRKYSVLYSI